MPPVNFTARAQLQRRLLAEARPELRPIVLAHCEEALRDRLVEIGVNPEVAAVFAFQFLGGDARATGNPPNRGA